MTQEAVITPAARGRALMARAPICSTTYGSAPHCTPLPAPRKVKRIQTVCCSYANANVLICAVNRPVLISARRQAACAASFRACDKCIRRESGNAGFGSQLIWPRYL